MWGKKSPWVTRDKEHRDKELSWQPVAGHVGEKVPLGKDKTIKLAKHAHEDKRTKAEAKFRRNPRWTYRIKNGKAYTETVDIYKWKEVRESKSTPKREGRVWSCAYCDQWLCVRERRCLKKRHPLWTHLELRRTVGEADVLDSAAFVIS
tara:strand:+ start:5774 stop:6220 length:447 start_codon:yes stop_codon:yes gene_type:complete